MRVDVKRRNIMIEKYKTPVMELFLIEKADIICNSLDSDEAPIIPANLGISNG